MEYSAKTLELAARVETFVRDVITPYERDPRNEEGVYCTGTLRTLTTAFN